MIAVLYQDVFGCSAKLILCICFLIIEKHMFEMKYLIGIGFFLFGIVFTFQLLNNV